MIAYLRVRTRSGCSRASPTRQEHAQPERPALGDVVDSADRGTLTRETRRDSDFDGQPEEPGPLGNYATRGAAADRPSG